jgi:hypothetical protein
VIELNLNPNTQAETLPTTILDDEFLVSERDPEYVLRARIISCPGEPLQLVMDFLPTDQKQRQFHFKPEDADRLAALLFKLRESHIRWHEA